MKGCGEFLVQICFYRNFLVKLFGYISVHSEDG